MSFNVSTGALSQGAVDQTNHNLLITFNGSWFIVGGDYYNHIRWGFDWSQNNGSTYIKGPYQTSPFVFGVYNGSGDNTGSFAYTVGQLIAAGYTIDVAITADTNCAYFAEAVFHNVNGTGTDRDNVGSTTFFKANAVTATASAPSSSAVTASTATVACNFFPNTNVSTASAWMEYRKQGDLVWIQQTAASYTGYTQQSTSANLTGLTGSTTYEFRLNMTRTTANATALQSSIGQFTTAAGAPTIVTNAASSVSQGSAVLNGTVSPNSVSTSYYFQYGLTNSYGTNTTTQGPSSSAGNVTFSASISGLAASTLYHYRAVATYAGGTVNGNDITFTTAASPLAAAASEDHMHLPQYDGTYGAATTIYFTLSSPAATSSDRLVTTAPGSLFVAGDIQVSKDGGALANVANSVTQITAANPLYSLVLSATEMQAENIVVQIVDQNGPAFRDLYILVRTKERLGQKITDATQIGGNTPAMTLTGIGTSPGLLATGGATSAGDITGVLTNHVIRKNTAQAGAASTITLDASASATDSVYNNCQIMLIGGTGAGQFRMITAYVGSTKVATVNRAWSTNPGASSVFIILPADDVWNIGASAELSAIPLDTANYSQLIQGIWERFSHKITEDSVNQIWYKADSATQLGSRTVSDDGTIQTTNKVA